MGHGVGDVVDAYELVGGSAVQLRIATWVLISALALTAGACAITEKVYEKDGRRYGVVEGAFRARWYNYYERGLSYAAGGYCEEANADFLAAIALRPADQRRARTYGLHFIDYFPNREYGICLLQQQQLIPALAALEKSLSQVDSGRAEYFANETRRAILLADGIEDKVGPTIDIKSPATPFARQPQLQLLAEVSDNAFVQRVLVNGKPLLLPVAVQQFAIDEAVTLQTGANVFEIEAWDLFGNTSKRRIEVALDEQPPSLTVDDAVEERGVRFLVGTVSDDSGVASLVVDGVKQPLPGKGNIASFEAKVKNDEVVVKVEDAAGNVTSQSVSLAAVAGKATSKDDRPPDIRLKEVPATVYTDRIYLDGSVIDASDVRELYLGDQSLLKTQSRTAYFRRLVRLQPGDNRLVIKAVDGKGLASEVTVEVRREIPAAFAEKNRLSIVMAPLAPVEDAKNVEAIALNLEAGLVAQERFYLLDRARISALITEWQLVVSDLAEDGPDLLRLGQNLSADTTLMGWVRETATSVEVYGRLVDSETGEIIVEKDVFNETKSLRTIEELLYGLALKLKAALPRIEGQVASRDGDQLRISMADAELLPKGARLIVVPSVSRDNPFGQELPVLAEARAVDGDQGQLVAELIGDAELGDAVVLVK